MKYTIVTVPTRILTKRDNIADAVKEFGKGKYGPNDVICVAESVVAVTQDRAVRCEDFQPTLLAKILCRFFPSVGSLSGWYSMQSLLDVEGTGKVLRAFFLGGLAKLVGKKGVFYELAGEQARLIDDLTGTMAPYDKHIVYGPSEPNKVAAAIKEATGAYGAAVADVNDLKRAAVIGTSAGVDPDLVGKILIDNPFGNGYERTPICIIKDYHK